MWWGPWLVAGVALFHIGFICIAFGYGFAAWAVAENRFFSEVVRTQADRDHVVCDTGQYRLLQHPGFADYVQRVRYRLIPGIY